MHHCCCYLSISASFLFASTTSSQEVQEEWCCCCSCNNGLPSSRMIMNRWVCLYPYLFLKVFSQFFSFEEFLRCQLPIQQMMCFLAAYHISCVAFFCQGIDKFLSIPIAHLLAEVMQIFGRVQFQLLLSCLWSSTPLKCKWLFLAGMVNSQVPCYRSHAAAWEVAGFFTFVMKIFKV